MLKIGACTVDAALDEISRDGNKVKIEPRAMRVLVYLAEHAGVVVSVEELLSHVWADLVVTPDPVYTTIAALRRALEDDSKEPRYIVNVPRRGYRLVASVALASGSEVAAAAPTANPPPAVPTVEIAESSTRRHTSRWWWWGAAIFGH
jgi:DNA-binding winged helix-turn-helix (wHTH) protein